MNRKHKIVILMIIDSLIILAATLMAVFLMNLLITLNLPVILSVLSTQIIMYCGLGYSMKIFHRINRYTNLKELIYIFIVFACMFIFQAVVLPLIGLPLSYRYLTLVYIISSFLIALSRIAWRVVYENYYTDHRTNRRKKKVLVFGAGTGAELLLSTLLDVHGQNLDMDIVGLVDDDKSKLHAFLLGKQVMGTTDDLERLIKMYQIEQLIIAIPSLSTPKVEEIVDRVRSLQVKVTSIPSIEELAKGDVNITRLRDIDVVDLLGREEIELDLDRIRDQLSNQTIMITGAGGSIGSEICRQVLRFNPRKIILLGHGENSIYLIDKELRTTYRRSNIEIVPIIADIQDKERIDHVVATYRPNIIYHAAAHKHVPLMEYNPSEAVKNNIYGTYHVVSAAKKYGVNSFVMVSTDKATNPPNVMGASKRIAEMIVTSMNEEGGTKFCAVRFGNVLGSRGSVVPLFKEQIKQGGPVTVTDFRMTRYFMTIPEASRLVIQAGALAQGGEIFILDMGEPVKIVDLAKKMIKLSGYSENEIQIKEVGIRPGEKLYEELLVDKERAKEQVFDKIFVGNISGFSSEDIQAFLADLPVDNDKALAKEVVRFANLSTK